MTIQQSAGRFKCLRLMYLQSKQINRCSLHAQGMEFTSVYAVIGLPLHAFRDAPEPTGSTPADRK
jgi:hypothetical protein